MHPPIPFLDLVRSDIEVWAGLRMDFSQPRPMRLSAARGVWLVLSYVGLRATVLYRASYALRCRGVRVLPQMLSRLNIMLHGLDIPSSVPIGPRFFVPHPVGTVIMAERLGSDVTVASNVTIGMRKEHAFPLIGDHVYIGAGARVLGGIRIGDHVEIGANAVVVKDVPSHSVAVGVPAQVRPR